MIPTSFGMQQTVMFITSQDLWGSQIFSGIQFKRVPHNSCCNGWWLIWRRVQWPCTRWPWYLTRTRKGQTHIPFQHKHVHFSSCSYRKVIKMPEWDTRCRLSVRKPLRNTWYKNKQWKYTLQERLKYILNEWLWKLNSGLCSFCLLARHVHLPFYWKAFKARIATWWNTGGAKLYVI